jgi:DNA-binding transcriptional LysR family regulator
MPPGIQMQPLGSITFVFAVAPHHPLAHVEGVLSDADLMHHRAVAVADSAQRMAPLTVNLLPGQDVLTVATMQNKIEAQLRCLGCGFLPEPLVREHIAAGRLVVKPVQRPTQVARLGYAWRSVPAGSATRKPQLGLALRWWLSQLESPATRSALIERHSGLLPLGGA